MSRILSKSNSKTKVHTLLKVFHLQHDNSTTAPRKASYPSKNSASMPVGGAFVLAVMWHTYSGPIKMQNDKRSAFNTSKIHEPSANMM